MILSGFVRAVWALPTCVCVCSREGTGCTSLYASGPSHTLVVVRKQLYNSGWIPSVTDVPPKHAQDFELHNSVILAQEGLKGIELLCFLAFHGSHAHCSLAGVEAPCDYPTSHAGVSLLGKSPGDDPPWEMSLYSNNDRYKDVTNKRHCNVPLTGLR